MRRRGSECGGVGIGAESLENLQAVDEMANLDTGAVEGAAHHDALQRTHADLLIMPDAEAVDEEVFELVEAIVLAPGLTEENKAWRRVC